MPWSWRDDSIEWNGLWCWRRIWEIKSASFEGWRDGMSWGFDGVEEKKRVKRVE